MNNKIIKKKRAVRIIIFLFAAILFAGLNWFPLSEVKAGSANIWFEELGNGAVAGNEVEVQIKISTDGVLGDFEGYFSYDDEVLQYISGPSCITGGNGKLKISDTGASPSWEARTYLLKFKAIKPGNCVFEMTGEPTAYDYEDASPMSVSSSAGSVVVQPAAEDSRNALLAALKISPGSLTPSFDKNTYEYNSVVDSDVTKLVISAVPEDSACTVSVSGNSNLVTGVNEVLVRVTAPAGNELLYTIRVVKEAVVTTEPSPTPQPQEAENRFGASMGNGNILLYGQYSYKVMDTSAGVSIPSGFSKSSILVDGQNVPVYLNAGELNSDFMLIVLENEAGEIGLYRYDRVEKTIQRYIAEKPTATEVSQSLVNQELLQNAQDLMNYDQNISKMSVALAAVAGVSLLLTAVVVWLLIKLHAANKDTLD